MRRPSATQGDITKGGFDAIVNAANSRLMGGGGVDGAIHRAGGPSILEECRAWVSANGPLPTGQAMATRGGALDVRHVIHTVGPVWGEHDAARSRALLADCYVNSLDLANELGAESIAFPNISTGVFGFPKGPAARVAVSAVSEWLARSGRAIARVVFVCHDPENLALYEELLGSSAP